MMEKTLVILKPCTLQRALVGEITSRFERKGLRLAGMKMVQLTDGGLDTIGQRTCVRNIAVHAFLKAQLGGGIKSHPR